MRRTTLSKLPLEDLKSDPNLEWAMNPASGQDEDGRLFWTISLLHRHWFNPDNAGSITSFYDNSSPPMFLCGLVIATTNYPERLDKNRAFPEYECDKCGKKVPKNVVMEKLERHKALKGVDPRNDRRGAVLATRDRNSQIRRNLVNG